MDILFLQLHLHDDAEIEGFCLKFKDGKSSTIDVPRVFVHITNDLPSLQLRLHCKDKNRDLGEQLLSVGQSFVFDFKPNFFGVSLYFCSFSYVGGFHYFDIYDEHRDKDNCKHECHWKIKNGGPCKEVSPTEEECFQWNKDVLE
ncbi:S-protein homolog 2-like [Trifolium pratense]|uniref:S-protein homolog 2-like n=1 Tax=Trifolium pratense TaxID=57577 RepID=UPI001E6955C6|nr:S-protein homolog 2-like [Trifolium pratense]